MCFTVTSALQQSETLSTTGPVAGWLLSVQLLWSFFHWRPAAAKDLTSPGNHSVLCAFPVVDSFLQSCLTCRLMPVADQLLLPISVFLPFLDLLPPFFFHSGRVVHRFTCSFPVLASVICWIMIQHIWLRFVADDVHQHDHSASLKQRLAILGMLLVCAPTFCLLRRDNLARTARYRSPPLRACTILWSVATLALHCRGKPCSTLLRSTSAAFRCSR